MSKRHVMREPKRDAELTDLILEKLAQRLEELEMQRVRQPSNIVMRFDAHRFLCLCARRFDYVGIDRALSEPLGIPDSGRLPLENLDEVFADDFALLLGIGYASERRIELLR